MTHARSTSTPRWRVILSGALTIAMLMALAPAGVVAAAEHADFQLTILHVNDGESALLPTADLPGAARFVADLKEMQVEAATAASEEDFDPGVITISSGDNYLAGPRLNASLDDPDAFYDALVYTEGGFDAMTIGNHEFDFGPDVLADFIEATVDIPFISANLDFSSEPRLAALESEGRIASSTIVEEAGRQIGVVGATTEQLNAISSPRNVVVSEVLPAVQAEVDALKAAGVGIIILSSHLQDLNEELSLVPHLSGVDAVVGGGGGEDIGDDYPRTATDADGRSVPVVTTPGDYADIGKLVLHFDNAGNLIKVGEDSALVPVPLEGPRDAFIEEHVEAPVAAYVEDLAANVIATTEVPLDGRRQNPGVRDRETNLGNLMADGHLFAARERAAAFGVPLADIALQNGGGMRQEQIITVGSITELDTFDIAAFTNFLSVAQITGTELKSALERSVAAKPGAGGFHGQWAGIKFNFDTSKQAQVVDFLAGEVTTEGERIQNAVVTRADGSRVSLVEDGVLMAPDEVFTIASIDFILRDGGDGYFSLEQPFTTLGITYQQSLRQRFEALGTVSSADYPDLTVDHDRYTRFGPVDEFSVEHPDTAVTAGPAVVRNATWYLREELSTGPADHVFNYGRATDVPLSCDWNGDGTSTPGVFRDGQWFLRHSNTAGAADVVFRYGRPGDHPVCGDWTGDGIDKPGVVRGDRWLLRLTASAGPADIAFNYGRAGDVPVVGDFNGDGTDGVGVRRGALWLLRMTPSAGFAEVSFGYGRSGDMPLVWQP
jgi:2',3'-cyclic-nucleotide 2'-phosphodiesterase (5'-nucleotidase family)